MPPLAPITTLNAADQAEFAAAIHLLFEPAPPLVRLLFARRPFVSYPALLDTAAAALSPIAGMFTEDELVEIINAHPRIGASAQHLSELSRREQGNAGVGNLHELEDALLSVNLAYEALYGFKLVVFVNGRTRREVLGVMQQMVRDAQDGKRPREEEMRRALADMVAIARDRLQKLMAMEEAGSDACRL